MVQEPVRAAWRRRVETGFVCNCVLGGILAAVRSRDAKLCHSPGARAAQGCYLYLYTYSHT